MSKSRLAILALALLLLAPPAFAQDQAHIDAAIKAYEARQQADTEKAHDQLVINHADQVLNDPASPVEGNPNGKFVMVEFFDYTCPYCKAVEPRLETLLKSDHKVKLVLKEFPILSPQSMIATRAALASVAQGKYKPFHQAMMNFRGQLLESDIFDMAKASGLDLARLRRDMTAPAIADEIIANFNLARGIRGFQTPIFIVGNHEMSSESASIDFPKAVATARGR